MANNVLQTTELLNKLNEILAKNSALLDKAAQSGEKFSKSLKLPSEYVNQLKNQETQAKKLGKAEKELDQTIKSKIPTLRQLASIKKSQDAADKREQRNLEKTTGLYNRVQIAVNKVTKRYNDLAIKKQLQGRLTAKEERDLTKLEAKLFKYNNALKTVDRQIGKNQRNVGNYSSALTGLGTTLRSLVGAFGFTSGVFLFAQGVRDAIQTVKDFDGGLKDVSKTTGLTGDDLEELGEGVIDLSEKLRVVGVKALLDYATVAGQLGVKGKENILEFAESLAVLETASDIQGEEGGRNIARLLTIVDGGVENVSDFADEIVILGNNFAATENEILSNATAIAQNTGVYKLGRQEVLAYATATKAVGLEAEIVGSTIGRSLATFEEAIRTGKGLTTVTELLGKSQEQLRREFKENASGVLTEFIGALSKLDKEGGSVLGTLDELGITAVRDKRVIASLATGGYDVLTRALTDVGNASGSALAEFETASSKLSLAFNKVENSWERFILAIESGNGVLSRAIIGTVDLLASSINNFTFLIDENNSKLGEAKIVLSGYGKNLEALSFGLIKSGNWFQKDIDLLIEDTRQRKENADAAKSQNENYVNLNGSLAPHLKLVEDITEEYGLLSSVLGFYGKEQKEELKTVADLRNQISELNKAILDSSTTDIEGIRIKQDKIKELQAELDAILGVEKSTKSLNKAKKDSIGFYEELISKLQTEQKNLATNSREYTIYENAIDDAKKKLQDFRNEIEGLSSVKSLGDFKTSWERIQEIISTPLKIEGIDYDLALNGLQDWSDEYEDQQKKISDIHKYYANQRRSYEDELARNLVTIGRSVLDSLFEVQLQRLDDEERVLEARGETALEFANGNAAAEIEIERQLQEKRAEIEEKRIETEKRAFLAQQAFTFAEITIDTIKQVAALKTQAAILLANPVTAPLASIALGQIPLVIATGATAGAAVLAQSIPAFWQGGEVGGSQQIMVNDDPYGRKGANYKEVVEKPNGQLLTPQGKNVKMTVPKGSFVHPTYDAFINSLDSELLSNNIMPIGMPNIMPMVVNKGLSKDDVLEVMNNHANKLVNTINNQRGVNISIDENGINKYVTKKGVTSKVMNARYKGVGKSV